MRTELSSSSTFRHHVGDIVFLSAQEQVLRPSAQSVVAVMQDQQTIWDGADQPLVDDAVDRSGSPIVEDLAVATSEPGSRPNHAVAVSDESIENADQRVGPLRRSHLDRLVHRSAVQPSLVMGSTPTAGIFGAIALIDAAAIPHPPSIPELVS